MTKVKHKIGSEVTAHLVQEIWREILEKKGVTEHDLELQHGYEVLENSETMLKIKVQYLDFTKVNERESTFEAEPDYNAEYDGVWDPDLEMHISIDMAREQGWFGEPEEKETTIGLMTITG